MWWQYCMQPTWAPWCCCCAGGKAALPPALAQQVHHTHIFRKKRGGTGDRGVAAYRRSGDGDTVQLQFKLQPQLLTITPFQLHWGADVTTLKKWWQLLMKLTISKNACKISVKKHVKPNVTVTFWHDNNYTLSARQEQFIYTYI